MASSLYSLAKNPLLFQITSFITLFLYNQKGHKDKRLHLQYKQSILLFFCLYYPTHLRLREDKFRIEVVALVGRETEC